MHKKETIQFKIKICALFAFFLVTFNVNAKVVTQENAIETVNSFLAAKGLSSKNMSLSRSSGDNSGLLKASTIDPPAYHIFSSTDRNDLIIVSGDDVARPILGYCIDHQNTENSEIPPAMKEWLDEMERQIMYARENGVEQSAEVALLWQSPGIGNVVKQLKTAKWYQDDPYNRQCPMQNGNRCFTGCSATAYAIAMKYYGYPSKGRGTTPAYTSPNSGVYVNSRNLNQHTYDWDSMPLEFVPGQYSSQQADNVALLMADIGAALQSDYSINGTSTISNYDNQTKAFFSYFGYNSVKSYKNDYTPEEWYSLLKIDLDNNHPVIYHGDEEGRIGFGHAFVIDGYTDQNYFSINWGWGGSENGFFALDALYTENHHYIESDQSAILNFQPTNTLPTVAIVNDSIECPSLDIAFAQAPYNGVTTHIKMVENLHLSKTYFILPGQNIILDLNGSEIDFYKNSLFDNYGSFTVNDSEDGGKITVSQGNTQIFYNFGLLTINGGEYVNKVTEIGSSEKDFRRCIVAAENSTTIINDGKFSCIGQVILSAGKLKIDNGEFTTTGNNCVLIFYANADTLTINGGTFRNLSKTKNSNDNRIALYTTPGTVTFITNGQFSSDYMGLYFKGEAVIDNADIENTGNGYGCLSLGNVVINDCKLNATTLLYADKGCSIKCYGGIFSRTVGAAFLGTDCLCISNDDNSTASKYPYKVINNSSEISPVYETGTNGKYYDLNGIIQQENRSKLQIIRKPDGNNIKVLNIKF